jgi:RimJ/RimL family protein N-acetyltransferase
MSTTLSTERLTLRPPAASDLDRLVDGIGNYAVAKFLTPVPHPYHRADAAAWLAAVADNPREDIFAIDLGSERFIGCISYGTELGFWIAEPFWGRGLMTEAARAVIEWKFEDAGVSLIDSGAHIDNPASMRVQEKLGFATTGRRTVFAQARQAEIDRFDTVLDRDDFAEACAALDAVAEGGVR